MTKQCKLGSTGTVVSLSKLWQSTDYTEGPGVRKNWPAIPWHTRTRAKPEVMGGEF